MFLQQLCEQLAMPEIEIRSTDIQIMLHFGPRRGHGIEAMKGGPIKSPDTNETMTPTKWDASGRVKHTGTRFLCVKKRPTRKVCD